MFANSEFLVLLNQAATDRAELAKLLNISENQMGYVTNAEAGHGLLRVGGAIVPFANEFPDRGPVSTMEHHAHRQVKSCRNSPQIEGSYF